MVVKVVATGAEAEKRIVAAGLTPGDISSVTSRNPGSASVSSPSQVKSSTQMAAPVSTSSGAAPSPFLQAPAPNMTSASTGLPVYGGADRDLGFDAGWQDLPATSPEALAASWKPSKARQEVDKYLPVVGPALGLSTPFSWSSSLPSKLSGGVDDFVGVASKGGKVLPLIAKNSASARTSALTIAKLARQLKKPSYVVGAVGAMIGTYPWAEWAFGEAKEVMGFNAKKAVDTGNPEIIRQFQAVNDEIFDVSFWEGVARLTPGANIAFAFMQKAKALDAQRMVVNAVVKDELFALEHGESDDQKWARIESERVAKKEAERLSDEAYYAEVERRRLAAKEAERAADEKYYADILARREKEVAAKQSYDDDYWIEYYKVQDRIRANNTPSNLKFGLL